MDLYERICKLSEMAGFNSDSFLSHIEFSLNDYLVDIVVKDYNSHKNDLNKSDCLKQLIDKYRELWNTNLTHKTWLNILDLVRNRIHNNYRTSPLLEDKLILYRSVKQECAFCHKKPPDVTLHIDHIEPVSKGGNSHFYNLQLLCKECNLAKSNKNLRRKAWISFE